MPTSGASSAITRRPRRCLSAGRVGLYVFLLTSACFFLLPVAVMLLTSLKSMDEIRAGNIFALPERPVLDAWFAAWSEACTGANCEGIRPGFWNSVRITIPSVALSVLAGAINGYALSFWRPKGGNLLFALLMLGAFVPYQIFLYPLVRSFAMLGLYNTIVGIVFVHVMFGLPLVTLLFRNYYASLPMEIFKAARVDGIGYWRILFELVLPLSRPMIMVASILQITGIWNDYILGLTFGGRDNAPMTIQLNNLVNSGTSQQVYNVNMAATLLTAAVPLLVYLLSGRWFVRGIAAGAVKG